MSHQALYRKFRPKIFDDVVGQEHITKTIKNQILSNNIAHAYLFSGIRGTGKTSTAKIFARAVNCLNSHDGNPCNECEICKSILNGTNMDVIEMDAASNNSVEDIRELRDKVSFLPVQSKYKVYIIDEVHMLSKGAFNALLKTLEEPPAHLLFILATTEPNKIPATILSRCQRFDLKRISVDTIVSNLRNICNEMNVDVDDKSLDLIASNSEGAMRDAQSILDRCMSFADGKIEYDSVLNILGAINYNVIIEISNAIIEKNIEKTITMVNEILNEGKESSIFLDELIIYFRNLLIVKTTNSTDNLIKASDEAVSDMKHQSDKLTISDIVYYIERLSETQLECKRVLNPKVLLETRLIKIMETGSVGDIEALTKRIEQLENIIKNGAVVVKNEMPSKKQTTTKTRSDTDSGAKAFAEPKAKKTATANLATLGQLDDNSIFETIQNRWQDILKEIRSENVGLQAIIKESKLIKVVNKKAIFEFDPKFTFHITAANQPKNITKFKEVLSSCLNTECEVEFTIKTEGKKPSEPEQTIEDIYEDLKNMFGEDKVELKQED